jgi:hypothetical protein
VCKQQIRATRLDTHLQRVHPNFNPATGMFNPPAGYASWKAYFKELQHLPETKRPFCPECSFSGLSTKLIKHLRHAHHITDAPAAPASIAKKAPVVKQASSSTPARPRNPKGQGLHFVSLDRLLAQENEDEDATYGWGQRYRERNRFGSPVMYDDHGDGSER